MKIKKQRRSNLIANFPLYRLLPSIVTIAAICIGLTAIKMAISLQWQTAVLLVITAAFLDGMDGRIARYLDASSDFGAELDSLADFCNFGITPILVVYLWSLLDHNYLTIGWGVILVVAVCMAIRLARFNTNHQIISGNFFQGVPAPIGGILTLLPIVVSFEFPYLTLFKDPWFLGCYELTIAFLMASRIPTFSIKKLSIPREHVALFLAFIALVIAALLIYTWLTVIVLAIIYIILIPFGFYIHCRKGQS